VTQPNDVVVGVVGAGTMGAGIAQVAAAAGHRTLLLDARPGAAGSAAAQVAERVHRSAAKGRLSSEQADAIVERLHPVSQVDDLAGCGLVVEAVVEDLAVKHRLLTDLEAVVADDAVLATNTSSLSVTDLAAPLAHPGRVAGLHFFNPAPVMRLVEVVRGARTDPAVVERLVALVQRWGKVPVVCASTPGFVVNRVARPFYGEALRLLASHGDALTPATVDALVRESAGFPMGPCELTDLIGQDVNAAVNRGVWRGLGEDPRYEPSVVQDDLVAAGDLGRKSGRGFYDHADAAAGDREPATLTPGSERAPRLRPSPGLAVLAERVGLPVDDAGGEDRGGADAGGAGAVAVQVTDGRTAAQVEAGTGTAVVLVDLVRDQAGCTRVGATASPGCPPRTLEALAEVLAPAGVAVSPLPDTPGLVVARTAACLVNAAEDAAEAGVADGEGVDLAMRHGAGYPVGPLAWGRELGHGWVVGVMDRLHAAEPSGRYRVSPTLRARAMLARDRVSAAYGIELVRAGPGHGAVRATVTESFLNGFDIVHGGVVCVIADTALAVACNSHGPLTVGAGLDVSWLSPGRVGDVLVATAVERVRYGAGRRNGLYDITVTREDGTPVAEVRGRTRVVDRGPRSTTSSEEQR
jgi:3-hydroxybutyryl-CoA dehydrogenase